MKARILTIALIAAIMLCGLACSSRQSETTVQSAPANEAISVWDVRFPCPAVGGALSYRMFLPKIAGQQRVPVLYLLHGANSGPVEITERSEVEHLAAAERLAVVIPDGGYSYFSNAKHKRNARWEDAITKDLRQDVQERFAVLAGREHTGIAGISMGGYAAAKLTLKHPELYGYTGVISGALDITRRPPSWRRFWQTWRIWTIFGIRRSARSNEDVFDLLQNSMPLPQTTWFASCGKNDPLLDANERFARRLHQHGVALKFITTASGHDWKSWNEAMPLMFHGAATALH